MQQLRKLKTFFYGKYEPRMNTRYYFALDFCQVRVRIFFMFNTSQLQEEHKKKNLKITQNGDEPSYLQLLSAIPATQEIINNLQVFYLYTIRFNFNADKET